MSKNGERLRHLYKGGKYRALRKRVFWRDGHKCVNCGATHNLTLDHITPRTQDESLFWNEDNCRTLCDECRVKNDLWMIHRGELPRPPRLEGA